MQLKLLLVVERKTYQFETTIVKWLLSFLGKSEDNVGQGLEYDNHDAEGKHIIPQPVGIVAHGSELSETIKGAKVATVLYRMKNENLALE